MSESKRTPLQIIRHDEYIQLVFEGYEVVTSYQLNGFRSTIDRLRAELAEARAKALEAKNEAD